ncbi:MAG: ABC transporter permease [Sulfuricella sp.]|nr:ABC transporter permease [Sulfuricella sp.]
MSGSFPTAEAGASLDKSNDGLVLRCSGIWTLQGIPSLEHHLAQTPWPDSGQILFDASAITAMDTAGAWLLFRTMNRFETGKFTVSRQGFRAEHEALLHLIREQSIDISLLGTPSHGFLERAGRLTWFHLTQLLGILAFLGESTMALLRCVAQPSRIRWRAILYNMQLAGFDALPIVGLLAFLTGIVVSYQGAVQLSRYGANIFVADLVGLSMLREMAPLLTAIIVAGRSGSAYAAQIGTMKVTEEIDALRTIGVSPMELLVLPKMLAMIIALPLLTVYADMLGVLGGMIIAQTQLNVSFADFLDRFGDAIELKHFMVGMGKAPVFAAIIALVGCFQGFRVSGSADSVGEQTTLSVVQAIFLVIVVDALFSVIFSWLNI